MSVLALLAWAGRSYLGPSWGAEAIITGPPLNGPLDREALLAHTSLDAAERSTLTASSIEIVDLGSTAPRLVRVQSASGDPKRDQKVVEKACLALSRVWEPPAGRFITAARIARVSPDRRELLERFFKSIVALSSLVLLLLYLLREPIRRGWQTSRRPRFSMRITVVPALGPRSPNHTS